jgi:hypothetical protein
MYSHEFLLCCCSYLNDESEKQTHLCRTIGLSDYRTVDQQAVGLTGCQIIATLPSVLSVLLRFTDSDYPFTFKLFLLELDIYYILFNLFFIH